jgi:hypothetical protein
MYNVAMTAEDQSYWEELPDGCPPADSCPPSQGMKVIRLIKQNPPTAEDFRSFRTLNPNKPAPTTECEASGLSVFTDLDDAERKRKLPKLKSSLPCLIRLTPQSGRIKQTGHPTHHTWWPSAQFPILENCQVDET